MNDAFIFSSFKTVDYYFYYFFEIFVLKNLLLSKQYFIIIKFHKIKLFYFLYLYN